MTTKLIFAAFTFVLSATVAKASHLDYIAGNFDRGSGVMWQAGEKGGGKSTPYRCRAKNFYKDGSLVVQTWYVYADGRETGPHTFVMKPEHNGFVIAESPKGEKPWFPRAQGRCYAPGYCGHFRQMADGSVLHALIMQDGRDVRVFRYSYKNGVVIQSTNEHYLRNP